MSNIFKVLPLISLLSLASPLAAEEQSVSEQLDLGQEVNGAATQPYTAEVNGSWEVRCIKIEGVETDPCEMYQLLNDDQGNATAEISMFKLDEGGQAIAGATITAPLETLLTSQLTISVDGAKAKRYPFSFCNPIGCFARIGLTAQDIETYQKGSEAVLTIVPAAAPDQKVNVKLSLSGFTKSYDNVAVVNN